VKRVLILTYYFPPFNHIATRRVAKMVKYLPLYGWEPVVVCLKWTAENCEYFDQEMMAEFDKSNVAKAIPYRIFTESNRIRRLLQKYTSTADIRILLTWFFLKFGYALEKCPPEFYYRAIAFIRNYLRSNKVDCIWASVPPQVTHVLADWTHRKFRLPWIADYRDIWDQTSLGRSERQKSYQIKVDKKIVSSSSAIVTVSEPLKETLQTRHKKPVYVIPNGFDPEDYKVEPLQRQDTLSIVYTGRVIFPAFDPSPLFEALCRLIQQGKVDSSKVSVTFFSGKDSFNILKDLLQRYPTLDGIARVLPYVPAHISIKMQKQACVLLHLAQVGEKGILTGKIFEYLGARRPVLCIPGDHDCVDELLKRTQAGVICRNAQETAEQLLRWYEEWQSTGTVSYFGKESEIMKCSRRKQAKQLADVLERHSAARPV
jgi:glycosyltransferase involved in cell wall biosynthesis